MAFPLPPTVDRDIAQQVVTQLAGEIGARPATSTAEARAAALVAAQMRQIGLEVSVQPFAAAAAPTAGLGFLAAFGVGAALLGWWFPLPSLLLTLLLTLVAVAELRGPPTLAALLRRRTSQNIIGTRAATQDARWRLVLLCHLDSPRVLHQRWARWLRFRLLYVPILLSVQSVVLMLHLARPRFGLLLLLLGVAQAIVVGAVLLRERRAHWTAGAVDAAGVGATLAAVAQTAPSKHTELWMIALGAGAASNAGLYALLRSFPFPADETWFINVPWIGRGTLTLVTGEGLWRERSPDPLLLQLFNELQTATTPLDQHRYRGERLHSAQLLSRGYHAASLVSLEKNKTAAGFRRADDDLDHLSPAQLQVATRLLRRAIQRFEELEVPAEAP